jgi:outer membrane protein TolC
LEPTSGESQLRISQPVFEVCCPPEVDVGLSPLSIDLSQLKPEDFQSLTLQDAIQIALANSRVMRDVGGAVLRSPTAITSVNDPAIVFSDPRYGEEAALSEFDAVLTSSAFFEKNDRQLNNRFFGNQGLFEQDLQNYGLALTKRSATGGRYIVRNSTIYDSNNQLSNAIGRSSWEQIMESEFRQPLMQGAGTRFNRIAGPGASPGQINGVLIARIRTDISLAEFNRAVRDLIADVENAYWDLYYSYRDLEAKIDARDIALLTARKLESQTATQGVADAAQAKEQYYRFESDVIDAIHGRVIDGTRTHNGSAGGSFRSTGGLRVTERRLRLLLGFPISDGRLLRPGDEPTQAPIACDWYFSSAEAINSREEIRRQKWIVKQKEMELIANRNFLMPQLDVVGRYRFRGFGKDLLAYDDRSNAIGNLLDGNYQEWQAGVEYAMPIGFRKAHAAVRQSQLLLHREMDILREQERLALFGLSNAMNEMQRAYDTMQLQERRLEEILRQLQSLQARWESGQDPALDVLLETHRRLLDARIRYHQTRIEYALAIRNVHYEKGSLLDYNNVTLSESLSDPKAYQDAEVREANRGKPW